MPREIIDQWDVASKTNPKKTYKVTYYNYGSWACSCPPWIYGNQDCEHIKARKDIYNKNYFQSIDMQKLGLEIDRYGYLLFWLEIEGHGCPAIIDYEDENIRKLLVKANEIVINDEKIKIPIEYPLSTELIFEYEKKGGFSRMDLFEYLYEAYKKIYIEEEGASGDPGTYENLYNRKKSSGPYGIWGHYMNELSIESLQYDPATRTLHVFIGS